MEMTGTIMNGVVILENGVLLPDGTRVRVTKLESPDEATTLGQRLMKFAGTVKGLPSDMARNHDHYIHGRPKQ